MTELIREAKKSQNQVMVSRYHQLNERVTWDRNHHQYLGRELKSNWYASYIFSFSLQVGWRHGSSSRPWKVRSVLYHFWIQVLRPRGSPSVLPFLMQWLWKPRVNRATSQDGGARGLWAEENLYWRQQPRSVLTMAVSVLIMPLLSHLVNISHIVLLMGKPYPLVSFNIYCENWKMYF